MKEVNLEDLIKETEQKILDNEYYEDVDVTYKDTIIHVRIRPISQAKFTKITNTSNVQSVAFNTDLLHECVLNKYDNSQFTKQQINDLFTGGLAIELAYKCLEVSGITLNQAQFNKQKKF